MNERYGRENEDKGWQRDDGRDRRNEADRTQRNFSRNETRESGPYAGEQQRDQRFRYDDESARRDQGYGPEYGSNSQYRPGAGQFRQSSQTYGSERDQYGSGRDQYGSGRDLYGAGRDQYGSGRDLWSSSQEWPSNRGRNQWSSDWESGGWSGSAPSNPVGARWSAGRSYGELRENTDWRSAAYGSSREGRYFGKGPKGYVRSDERIREDVCDRLSNDDEVDASDITVTVKDGEVKLEGTVPDRRSKHRAEDIADAVGGVKDVHNSLRAQKSFFQEVGDRLTGNDEGQQHGHSGSGTRNGGPSGSSVGSPASRS